MHLPNCYETCINKGFLIKPKLLKKMVIMVAGLEINAKTGRPPIDPARGLNAVFYVLRTGIQWDALPKCFGSSSAVHRFFQKLVRIKFFEKFWMEELRTYNEKHGLKLGTQAADCVHIKSPLGSEATGHSPVDRRKLGTKRSMVVDGEGIMIGCVIGAGNTYDPALLHATIEAIPKFLVQPYYKEMNLDGIYDTEEVKTILFNKYYVPKIATNPRNCKNKKKQNPLGYKRWFVERSHSWLNKFRRLYIRYEKSVKNYLALTLFAAGTIVFNKSGV
jgi:putative transposase